VKRFAWEPAARVDLRRIEQKQAIQILHALSDFSESGNGDVKKLVGDTLGRYRLRVGDWRILFRLEKASLIHILSVENRKDAYR
jgi:mRNA-degrading endonuclease RelE of RelBE toxin-antitoxin system